MATFLRTTVKNNIGTTPVDVLAPGINSNYTVIGCSLANTTDDNVNITITITDASNNVGTFVNGLVISPYHSAKIITNGEKLIIAGSCKMTIVSDTANGVDAVISYAEIV